MATRKRPSKAARPHVPEKAAPKRRILGKAKKRAVQKGSAPSQNTPETPPAGTTRGAASGDIRVRMYRVGFGDFFLLTVPGKNGPAHILIDCGVHAGDIHTIGECVQDMKRETGNHLALVILTHYHADHMSGFASNYDDFTQFEVGAVWITNRLDPNDKDASKFMVQLTSVAQHLRLQLGARTDPDGIKRTAKWRTPWGYPRTVAAAATPKR